VKPNTFYGHQARYVRAVAKFNAGDTGGATKLLDEIIGGKGADKVTVARARLVRARLLYEAKKNEEALAEYLQVKRTDITQAGGCSWSAPGPASGSAPTTTRWACSTR